MAAIFLTACAGVAAGEGVLSANGPQVLGPGVDVLSVPAFDFDLFPAAETMQLRTLAVERQVEQAVQQQLLSQMFEFGCGHGAH